jgi:hypothetical protein
MFSESDWQLLREACAQRGRQWRDQALTVERPHLKERYGRNADRYESLVQRIETRSPDFATLSEVQAVIEMEA